MPGLVEAAHPRVIRLAGCFSSRMHTPPMARHFIVLTDDRLTAFVELHGSIHRQLELRWSTGKSSLTIPMMLDGIAAVSQVTTHRRCSFKQGLGRRLQPESLFLLVNEYVIRFRWHR